MTQWADRRRINQRIYDQLSDSERDALAMVERIHTAGYPANEPEYQEKGDDNARDDVR